MVSKSDSDDRTKPPFVMEEIGQIEFDPNIAGHGETMARFLLEEHGVLPGRAYEGQLWCLKSDEKVIAWYFGGPWSAKNASEIILYKGAKDYLLRSERMQSICSGWPIEARVILALMESWLALRGSDLLKKSNPVVSLFGLLENCLYGLLLTDEANEAAASIGFEHGFDDHEYDRYVELRKIYEAASGKSLPATSEDLERVLPLEWREGRLRSIAWRLPEATTLFYHLLMDEDIIMG